MKKPIDITGIEVCEFTKEEIEEALEGLEGLQEIIVPWLKSANYEGQGETDAEDCKKHLMMGKHALALLLDAMETGGYFK